MQQTLQAQARFAPTPLLTTMAPMVLLARLLPRHLPVHLCAAVLLQQSLDKWGTVPHIAPMHYLIFIFITIATTGPRAGLPNVTREEHILVRGSGPDVVQKVYPETRLRYRWQMILN